MLITFDVEENYIVGTTLTHDSKPTLQWEIEGGVTTARQTIESWACAYSTKQQPTTDLPLLWPLMPPFTLKVLQELQKIPFGITISYGDLAAKAGNARAYRAAGTACGLNPFPLIVPCHRILHAGGKIGGFSLGIDKKKWLLDFEKKIGFG